MGIIRLLLAIAVLVTHSETLFGLHMTGGTVAVQAFYIVSGFYMALVLEENYLKIQNGYTLFISNRFLRLYPAYWVVLIMTIAISVIAGLTLGSYFKIAPYTSGPHLHWSTYLYLAVSNAGIFGQDMAMFTCFDGNGALHFVKNFSDCDPRVHQYLFIPQAWTISLELMFYLIAPFLVRLKSGMLSIIAVASIAARIFAIYHGYDEDPWTYRFFPFELLFFVAGILSWRLFKKIEMHPVLPKMGWTAMIIFPLVILAFYEISFDGFRWIFYAAFAIALPGIFTVTKNSSIDRYLGEYSYPIYISHLLILFAATKIIVKLGLSLNWTAEIALILTMIFCFLMIRYITNPIEKFRAKRVKSKF